MGSYIPVFIDREHLQEGFHPLVRGNPLEAHLPVRAVGLRTDSQRQFGGELQLDEKTISI
jgi:hypothetical protein